MKRERETDTEVFYSETLSTAKIIHRRWLKKYEYGVLVT